jgi:hypothetical protein
MPFFSSTFAEIACGRDAITAAGCASATADKASRGFSGRSSLCAAALLNRPVVHPGDVQAKNSMRGMRGFSRRSRRFVAVVTK